MKTTKAWVRWMVTADLNRVVEIENDCFAFPWSEEDFRQAMKALHARGQIVEAEGITAGFAIHEHHGENIQIVNFAIAPEFQRERIGTQLLDAVKKMLPKQSKTANVIVDVHENFVEAQLFFRSQGFFATEIFKGYFDEDGRDAYRMVYSPYGTPRRFLNFKNRVQEYLS